MGLSSVVVRNEFAVVLSDVIKIVGDGAVSGHFVQHTEPLGHFRVCTVHQQT